MLDREQEMRKLVPVFIVNLRGGDSADENVFSRGLCSTVGAKGRAPKDRPCMRLSQIRLSDPPNITDLTSPCCREMNDR
jgi:hypothetical protein